MNLSTTIALVGRVTRSAIWIGLDGYVWVSWCGQSYDYDSHLLCALGWEVKSQQ